MLQGFGFLIPSSRWLSGLVSSHAQEKAPQQLAPWLTGSQSGQMTLSVLVPEAGGAAEETALVPSTASLLGGPQEASVRWTGSCFAPGEGHAGA